VFPGTRLAVHIWKAEERTVFRTFDEQGHIVMDHGVAALRS
jgi:hypothetical protein